MAGMPIELLDWMFLPWGIGALLAGWGLCVYLERCN